MYFSGYIFNHPQNALKMAHNHPQGSSLEPSKFWGQVTLSAVSPHILSMIELTPRGASIGQTHTHVLITFNRQRMSPASNASCQILWLGSRPPPTKAQQGKRSLPHHLYIDGSCRPESGINVFLPLQPPGTPPAWTPQASGPMDHALPPGR